MIADARTAIANVDSAAEGLPQLMDNLTAVSNSVKALPLEDLVATGTRVLGDRRRLPRQPAGAGRAAQAQRLARGAARASSPTSTRAGPRRT